MWSCSRREIEKKLLKLALFLFLIRWQCFLKSLSLEAGNKRIPQGDRLIFYLIYFLRNQQFLEAVNKRNSEYIDLKLVKLESDSIHLIFPLLKLNKCGKNARKVSVMYLEKSKWFLKNRFFTDATAVIKIILRIAS